MNRERLILAVVALVIVAFTAVGLSMSGRNDSPRKDKVQFADKKGKEQLSDACSSSGTYARLKQVAFEEAVRIRNADPTNLDTLAANSVVRMENPVVKSQDEDLNVTVCTGRFVLELPPGAERAFGGDRRLVAEVEYAAQAATDGSGMVYQMNGAEPIIYKLAAFNLQGDSYLRPDGSASEEVEFADAGTVQTGAGGPSDDVDPAPARSEDEEDEPRRAPVRAAPEPRPTVVARAEPKQQLKAAQLKAAQPKERPKQLAKVERPEPRRVVERPEPRQTAERQQTAARPSFNCRAGRSRSEQMVCNSNRLAAKDRAMSSVFYSALADANPRAKRELRQSRDRFLAYRERCPDEACVAAAYDDRISEIRDIMSVSD